MRGLFINILYPAGLQGGPAWWLQKGGSDMCTRTWIDNEPVVDRMSQ